MTLLRRGMRAVTDEDVRACLLFAQKSLAEAG